MEQNTDVILQKDGCKSLLHHFYGPGEPKASLIVLHGMIEHHKRYLRLADYLAFRGIDVYLYDHRGHGTDKNLKEVGFISNSRGHEVITGDVLEIIKFVKAEGRSKKLFLLGHSMGSLILRNVIQQYDDIEGVILSGTTHPPKIRTWLGLFLSSLIKLLYGPKHYSKFINQMMFGGKSYTKLCSRTSFDWLSRNNKSIGEYIHDPYCGFICTVSFYHDLIKLVSAATTVKLIKHTRRNLPVFIISGEQDPVGAYGKEINHLVHLYQKLGFTKISSKLYPEYRHEILQETDAKKVMDDISSWILKQV